MARSLRRVVLAAIMALVLVLFTSAAHVSRAIVEDMDLPFETEMPAIPRVEALAAYEFTPAQRTNTLKMLQAFAAAMPALQSDWTGSSFCDWTGVTCYQLSVYLAPTQVVTGTLPEVPSDVNGTEVLLDTISFYDKGASVSGTLPDSWSRLTNLATLNLALTGVSGTLPSSWGSLNKLGYLSLFSTSVGGWLPVEWTGMTSLATFVAYGTQITGLLPTEWSVMPALSMIQLQKCRLVGSLPASWSEMPKLARMALNDNDFCGCVPASWKTTTTLRVSLELKYSASSCATELACPVATTTTTTQKPTTTSTTTTTHPPSTARPSTFAKMMKTMCNNTESVADNLLNTYKSSICCSNNNISGDSWKCGDAIYNILDATVNCSAPVLSKDFKCCAHVDEYGNRAWVGWSCNGVHSVVSALVAVVAVVAVALSSAM